MSDEPFTLGPTITRRVRHDDNGALKAAALVNETIEEVDVQFGNAMDAERGYLVDLWLELDSRIVPVPTTLATRMTKYAARELLDQLRRLEEEGHI